MNSQKLYINKVLPYINKFKKCEIYSYEIKNIEQELAESFNKKNIHEALDIPDFKDVKDTKILPKIINIAIKKLKLSETIEFIRLGNKKIIRMDNKNYQLVVFCMGEVPKICYTEKNIIFFLYQPGFNKIYYCGKLFLKKEELTTTSHDFTNFEVLEIC